MSAWRIFAAMHGHLAILAGAALFHPAILLRKGAPLSGRARLSVALTALFVTAAFCTGLALYPAYIAAVRVPLFLRSGGAGLAFETKEHLAFAVVGITAGASACALIAPADARDLRRAAAAAFAASAALCLAAAALGTWVASVHGFPDH